MNTGYLIYQAERTRSGAGRGRAPGAGPIVLGQQPAVVWRRIAGSS